jgi:hypothetical protein
MSTFLEKVKELFKNDPDACSEALERAREMLADAKAEVIEFAKEEPWKS